MRRPEDYFEQHGNSYRYLPGGNGSEIGGKANGHDAEAWPTPTPLPASLPPVMPFDPALLPKALRPWIMDIAERLQCPPDFSTVAAMASIGAVVGEQVAIRPKRWSAALRSIVVLAMIEDGESPAPSVYASCRTKSGPCGAAQRCPDRRPPA